MSSLTQLAKKFQEKKKKEDNKKNRYGDDNWTPEPVNSSKYDSCSLNYNFLSSSHDSPSSSCDSSGCCGE